MIAEDLPRELREALSALPGVVAVYPARPALRTVVDAAVGGVAGLVGGLREAALPGLGATRPPVGTAGPAAAAPPAESALGTPAAAAAVAAGDEPVVVTERDGRVHVAATLGITDSVPAAASARAAYDVVAAHLAAAGLAIGDIRILIANIDPA